MRVFVGCSASSNVPLEYKDMATEVATILAKRGHKLVFGGSESGMMGKAYMTYKYEDGHVKAVVDIKNSDNLEVLDVDAYEVTTSTFQRTERLYKSSELVVILPGGIGTMAELCATIDELRTHKDDTKLVIFNYDNFYKSFINYLKKCYKLNFVTDSDLKLISIVNDLDEFNLYLDKIEKERSEE